MSIEGNQVPYYQQVETELPVKYFAKGTWQREMCERGHKFYGYPMDKQQIAELEARIEASKARQRAVEAERIANSQSEIDAVAISAVGELATLQSLQPVEDEAQVLSVAAA